MSTATVNIETYVGDNVSRVISFVSSDRVTPINITGRTYTALAFNTDGTTAATFSTSVSGAAGTVTISLPNATTTTLGAGAWRWSLVENASSVITTLLVGTFAISSEV